jgi:hypothetical protein
VGEIEQLVAKYNRELTPEKRNDVARAAVFQLVSTVTFGAIYKTAISVGSQHLNEIVSSVAASRDTTTYRLIELAAKLESHGRLPQPLISRLKQRTDANAFGRRILQHLIVNHLYMFKSTEAEKQRVCQDLGISVARQRGIDLKTKDSKRTK